jgi:hypothetical protein
MGRRRNLSPCATPGCPDLTANTHCPAHTRTADKARGTRQARGYGATHDRLRQRWAPHVAAGSVRCARCGKPITPGTPWDLDHTDDRRTYRGPSHAHCNRGAR